MAFTPDPHLAYFAEVFAAVDRAALPDSTWSENNGGERLDGGCLWWADNPALTTTRFRHGVAITWDQFDGWQYASVQADGSLGGFTELIGEMYPDPAAVATAAGLLLQGTLDQFPIRDAARWKDADALHDAILAWMDTLPQ